MANSTRLARMAVQGTWDADATASLTSRFLSARRTSHISRAASLPRLIRHHATFPSLKRQEQPWLQEPSIQERFKPECEEGGADFCAAFGTSSLASAQDVVASLILSEAVYKILDGSLEDAVKQTEDAMQDFPAELVEDLHLQWSLPHVGHRYLIAEGKHAMYVAFMGTKERRDLLTNAAVVQELLWQEHRFSVLGEPAAHTGFLRRARGIPVHDLYQLAQGRQKKLVLCGHSLGGAVAELCALDLLHSFPADRTPDVQAIGFATPAVGNEALAKYVLRRGWQSRLRNYVLPEDKIGNILGFSILVNETTQEKQPAAEVAAPCPDQARAEISVHAIAASAPQVPQNLPTRTTTSAKSANNVVVLRRRKDKSTPPVRNTKLTDTLLEEQKVARMAWAATFAARTATFPLWAHRSFTAAGQRFYLNPKGVSSLAVAQTTSAKISTSAVLVRDKAAPGAVANSSKNMAEQQGSHILWMHRLPTYRARLLRIAGPSKSEPSSTPKVTLSAQVAPPMKAESAYALHDLEPCNGLKAGQALLHECLRAARLKGPWPRHWQQLLEASLASSHNNFRWKDIASGWMHLLQRRLWGIAAQKPIRDETLLLEVAGTGLSRCSCIRVQSPEGTWLPTEVITVKQGLAGLLKQGTASKASPLASFLAWLQLASSHAEPKKNAEVPLLLKVQLPGRVATQLKEPGRQGGLRVHLQSDFYSQLIPVQIKECPKPARLWTWKQVPASFVPKIERQQQLS